MFVKQLPQWTLVGDRCDSRFWTLLTIPDSQVAAVEGVIGN